MKVKNFVIVGIFALALPAYGATQQEIAKCAAIAGDGARLVCYDELANKLGVDEPETSRLSNASEWQATRQVSPIDDSENVILSLPAENPIKSGYHTVTPTLDGSV